MPIAAREIVEGTRLPGFNRVFAIGLHGKRITIHSQQLRAFNLADALSREAIVTPRSRVAVIGGGIAGLSMAAALALRAAPTIHIYESSDNLLRLQRGNKTRFLHPTVYDWPHPGSMKPYTDLPALNWRASPSNEVALSIWRQFLELNHPFEIGLGRTAIAPVERADRCYVSCKETLPLEEVFDVVVVCIGFGKERGLFGKPAVSYWEMDNLETLHWQDEQLPEALVVGAGDGGLIDAIRIALVDFDQGDVIQELINAGNVVAWAAGIDKSEQNLRSKMDGRDLAWEINRLYLENDHPPAYLVKTMRAHRRKGVTVSLTDVAGCPFGPNASLMNKVLVSVLMRDGAIRWREPGTVPLPALDLKDAALKKAADGFDAWRRDQGIGLVVERIGTEKPLPPFLGINAITADSQREAVDQRIGSEIFFDRLAFTAIPRSKPTPDFSILILTAGPEGPEKIGGGGSRDVTLHAEVRLRRLEADQRRAITISSIALDPRLSLDEYNVSLIKEYQDTVKPDCTIFMGSDVARIAPRVLGGGKTVLFCESRIAQEIGAYLSAKGATEDVFFLTQTVNFGDLCRVIESAIPRKTLGYIFCDDYPIDRMFFDALKAEWERARVAGSVTFELAPIRLGPGYISIVSLPKFDVYCGRIFVQLNGGTKLMRSLPYISGFARDIEFGAIAAADTDYSYISDEIVDGFVRPIIVGEPPAEVYKDIVQRLYIGSRNNARRVNITISDRFFALPNVSER